MKFQGLTLAEVLAMVKASRSAWYRAMKVGDAPQPFKVTGGRRVAWLRAEVDAYIARRVAERDAKAAAPSPQNSGEMLPAGGEQ